MAPSDMDAEFQCALEKYTRVAVCGRHFILVDKLQIWLRSLVNPDVPTVTRADRLLHVACRSRTSPALPVTSNVFLEGTSCCLLIFCILQDIGCGRALPEFARLEKWDSLLPLRWDTIQRTFSEACIHDSNLQAKFFKLQYRYRPARFDLYQGVNWEENMVVPICEKHMINKKGGTAELYQIAVPEEFVGQNLRAISSGSRFNAGTENEPEWYQFALKTFHGTKKSLYRDEMDALRGLKDHEGMVRWLADYKKIQSPGGVRGHDAVESSNQISEHATYNILLEYGEMDLGNYFVEMEPPVRPSDIEVFWRSVFAVADAVKGIHNLKVVDAGIEREYDGWHTDIKPDNILYIEERLHADDSRNGHGGPKPTIREKAFKLADPGFAKFVLKAQNASQAVQNVVPKAVLNGGTETYGAPEYPGWSEKPVSQAIDIWSLGCVLSLAATWIVLGLRGVHQFQVLRQRAINQQVQARRFWNNPQDQATKASQGDHFHDGHRVLEDVTKWHAFLRTALRNTDTITSQVLDLVDTQMLLGNADDRITATDLCSKLESILKSRPLRSEPHLPDTIKMSLGEYAFIREIRRSSSYERRLRTTYRPSLRPDQKSQKPEPLQPIQIPPRTPLRSRNWPGYKKKHPPMNVFQAQQALEQCKRDRTSLDKIRNRSNKCKFQDGLLTSYFQGTRDIMFLIDNAESMEANWYEATFLLRTLVEMAEGQDEDGMDLRFTASKTKLDGKDSADKFVNAMNKARPTRGARTDLRRPLGEILDTYWGKMKNKAKFPNNMVKDLVLVILTDGIWAGMDDKMAIAKQLKKFSQEVDYDVKQRPFSVQFIQFGNDEAATDALKYLDDYLEGEDIPDFIDTEHSSGDVNKMLLGSFIEEYDRDEGGEGEYIDSPSPSRSLGSPYSRQTFAERETPPDSRNGGHHPNFQQTSQGVHFSSPPRRNQPRPFAMAELDGRHLH